MSDTQDKAGKTYWDRAWTGKQLPEPVNPRSSALKNYVYRRFHGYFASAFAGQNTQEQHLLEIGCARSRWLPYFAKEYGFSVSGLDYSEIGCEQARALLDAASVDGNVVCADFFSPPVDMLGIFDVVVSFGVVEHFADTAACLAALSAFLKPGGLMITSIPNFTGWIGVVQKRLNRSVYDIHVPLDRETLRSAHERVRLSVQSCEYFLGFHWGVIDLVTGRSTGYLYRFLRILPAAISIPFWFLEQNGGAVKPNRLTSPFVICSARQAHN